MATELREPQNQRLYDIRDQHGSTSLTVAANQTWIEDPKRLGMMLARYKFVSKMFGGYRAVVEIGCGDGFGSRVVAQAVATLHLIDVDPLFVAEAQKNMRLPFVDHAPRGWSAFVHDAARDPLPHGVYDGAFALDVIEHIHSDDAEQFLDNIGGTLKADGVAIIGTPSANASGYASPMSKRGHINLYSPERLRQSMQRRFERVFMFAMNDELVHVGFLPMAHYLLAMGVGQK